MENRKVLTTLALAVVFILSLTIIVYSGFLIFIIPVSILMQGLLVWWFLSCVKQKRKDSGQ